MDVAKGGASALRLTAPYTLAEFCRSSHPVRDKLVVGLSDNHLSRTGCVTYLLALMGDPWR